MILNLELLKLLPSLFNVLDALIENYGVYFYLVFVWLALAAIAWIISDGLGRRMKGNPATVIPAVIIMAQSSRQPEPPIVDIVVEQAWNDDDEMMDEP
jgi:hypothetical protein